jgi:glycosyltransferase involved in cell wall biosynthesis
MSSNTNGKPSPLVAVFVISDLEFGGLQRQIINVANYMDEERCRVYICSLAECVPMASVLKHREQRLKIILRRSRFDLSVVPRLARLLRETGADIVYNNLFDSTIAGRLAGRWARRPAVIDSEANTNYKLKRIEAVAFRLTRWCNDMTIANSRAGAAWQSRLLGQSADTYRVVYNGVDTDRFHPREAAAARASLGLSGAEPVMGMFASFKPQKNHIVWLRAARRVAERFPDLKLLFVGDELFKGGSNSTEYKKNLSQAVDDLGLRSRCLFAGNRPDVENYYNVCAATVLPSLYEGMPNVALESMACGVPVIATDVADNAYLIPDGQAGFIVPVNDEDALADRVCRLLADSPLRQRLSGYAREWMAREFSCKKFADNTLAVFQEALARRSGRRPAGLREGALSGHNPSSI